MIFPKSLIQSLFALYGFGERANMPRQRQAPIVIGHSARRFG